MKKDEVDQKRNYQGLRKVSARTKEDEAIIE